MLTLRNELVHYFMIVLLLLYSSIVVIFLYLEHELQKLSFIVAQTTEFSNHLLKHQFWDITGLTNSSLNITNSARTTSTKLELLLIKGKRFPNFKHRVAITNKRFDCN